MSGMYRLQRRELVVRLHAMRGKCQITIRYRINKQLCSECKDIIMLTCTYAGYITRALCSVNMSTNDSYKNSI